MFAIGVEAVENKEWKFEMIFLGVGEFRYLILFECQSNSELWRGPRDGPPPELDFSRN